MCVAPVKLFVRAVRPRTSIRSPLPPAAGERSPSLLQGTLCDGAEIVCHPEAGLTCSIRRLSCGRCAVLQIGFRSSLSAVARDAQIPPRSKANRSMLTLGWPSATLGSLRARQTPTALRHLCHAGQCTSLSLCILSRARRRFRQNGRGPSRVICRTAYGARARMRLFVLICLTRGIVMMWFNEHDALRSASAAERKRDVVPVP